jgi:hypothetical protein
MIKFSARAFGASLLILSFFNGYSQEKPINEVRAAIIYNLMKYIQWANEGNGKESFVIGVYGDEKLYSTLSGAYRNKSKGVKKIIINNITDLDELASCDLFFLGEPKLNEFGKVKEAVASKPILTITGSESYAKKGAGINLVTVDERMVIEVNETVLNQSGFKVSGTLLSMAKIIK